MPSRRFVTVTDMTDRPGRQRGGQAPAARRRARSLRHGRRGRRHGHLPALGRVVAVHGPDAQPQRRGVTCRDPCHQAFARGGRAGQGWPDLRRRWLRRRPCAAAAIHRRARNRLQGDGPPARSDVGARRRDRRLRRPWLLAARARRACTSGRSARNIGNEPRLGAMVENNELEAYSFPQGVLSQLMGEIAAGRPGPGHARRPGHVRRPAPDRRQAELAHDGRPRRGRQPARPASGCCTTRSRSTSPSSAARPPTRTATSRWRARPSRPRCSTWPWPRATAAGSSSPRSASSRGAARCRSATSRCRRARRLRLRRSRPVADVHHADSPYYAGKLRKPVVPRAAAAARRAQDHRPPLAARVPAGQHLQPRLRHLASSSAASRGRRASPTSWC